MNNEELVRRLQAFNKEAEVILVDGTLGEYDIHDVTQTGNQKQIGIWFGGEKK
jgi:hypothetical protein